MCARYGERFWWWLKWRQLVLPGRPAGRRLALGRLCRYAARGDRPPSVPGSTQRCRSAAAVGQCGRIAMAKRTGARVLQHGFQCRKSQPQPVGIPGRFSWSIHAQRTFQILQYAQVVQRVHFSGDQPGQGPYTGALGSKGGTGCTSSRRRLGPKVGAVWSGALVWPLGRWKAVPLGTMLEARPW